MYRSSRGDLLVSGGERWNKTSYNYKLGFDLEAGYTFLENHRIGVNFYYSNLKGVNLPSGGYLDTLGTSSLNYGSNDIYLHNTTFTYAGATPDKVFNWSAAYTFGEVDNLGTYYSNASYPNVDNTYRMHVKMDEFKAQLTFDKQIIALTGGFDYLNYIYSTESLYPAFPPATVTEIVTKDLAFYILAKAKLLNDRLIISAAGRYDVYDSDVQGVNFSKTNTVFSPSIGVAFMPADFIKLRANYSEGVRMPNPSYILGIPGQINPNHDLDIERSKSFEIGFDLSYDYIDASLTYFHTNVINKIVRTGSFYDWTFYNLDKKATLAGFEASFRFDIGKMLERDFTLAPYMSLTWLTTRKHGQDTAVIPQAPKTLPDVPTFMATYGIDFEHPGIGLSANLNFSYIGYRWTQDFSWMAQAAKGGQWYNHGGDTVVDISVKQRLWDTGDKGQFYAKASVTNLFDTNYSYTYDYAMPGRSFYLGLGYEY
ncbi:MAG: TonB-dependent receptor [Deltaproteobacteria bacterium]|nr:TonB-dependent receptor [Deltaproteobacteria bacterium]